MNCFTVLSYPGDQANKAAQIVYMRKPVMSPSSVINALAVKGPIPDIDFNNE